MGGHGHDHGEKLSPEHLKLWGRFRPPHVNQWHRRGAVVMGTTLWLWVFYRLSQDWPVMFVRRWRHSLASSLA